MFDILIKNGNIIDGSGKKSFQADIGIERDIIVDIGNLQNAPAKKTIGAKNLTVCPGFVDILNRSDTFGTLFENPSQESLLRQGTTTIIGGNCGASLAPIISIHAINAIQKWTDIKNVAINWSSMAEFLYELSHKEIGVNFGTLVGHTTLRRGLLKDEIRPFQKDEMDKMKYIVEESIKDGALGLSAGLVYAHSKIATTEELIELGKITAKNNGFLSLHLRNEEKDTIGAVNEAIRISQEAEIPVEIAHLKIIGQENWPMMDKTLSMIEIANRSGAQITFDVFPYTFSASVLYTTLPDRLVNENKDNLVNMINDKEQKKIIVADMQKNPKFDYGKIIIAMSSGDKSFIGHTVQSIAQDHGLSQEEVILHLIIESRGRMIGFIPDISEENIKKQISNNFSFIASNGAGYGLRHKISKELAHPRCFGAFPRAIRKYALDEKIVSLEEIIAKMTLKPAQKIGLKKRGELKVKNYADVVIFDQDKIRDNAIIQSPYQFADGIEYVLVNGQVAVSNGNYNGLLKGKVLRKFIDA